MDKSIRISNVVEHEDGSATVTMDIDQETLMKVFEIGLNHLVNQDSNSEPYEYSNGMNQPQPEIQERYDEYMRRMMKESKTK